VICPECETKMKKKWFSVYSGAFSVQRYKWKCPECGTIREMGKKGVRKEML